MGEVYKLSFHHGVRNGEVAAAFDGVAVKREQTVQRRTVLDHFVYGLHGVLVWASFGGLSLAFFLGFLTTLGVGLSGEGCGHQTHAEQGYCRDGKLPHKGYQVKIRLNSKIGARGAVFT